MFTMELIGTVAVGIAVVALVGYLIGIVNGIRREVQEAKAATASELGRLNSEIANNRNVISKELQSTRSDLSAAIDGLQSGLADTIKAKISESTNVHKDAIDSVLNKLSLHDEAVSAAINEIKQAQQATQDEFNEALKSKKSSSPPEADSDHSELDQPDSSAVATATVTEPVKEAIPPPVEDVESVQETAPETASEPDGRIVYWKDLPEHIRKLWEKQITEQTIPPVSFDAGYENASPKELVNKVKHDPMLCAKILAVANSAAQGQVKPVTSIERAAVQLGTNMLQIIIAAYHMEAIFGRYPNYSKEHFSFVQRWSCGSSVIAYHLAGNADSEQRAVLSTAALISRLGSLLLGIIAKGPDQDYRSIVCEAERYEFEMQRWGVSTPLLSEQLALHWGLPEPLPTLLRFQEKPLVAELSASQEDSDLLIICLAAAITSSYLSKGGDNPLGVLSSEHCEMLNRNMEAHNMTQATIDAWHSKGLQREFLSIIE